MITDPEVILNKENCLHTVLLQLMNQFHIDTMKLSEETKVPITTLNRLKSNSITNPTLNTLLPIANYFDISIDQLIGKDPLPDKLILDKNTHLLKTPKKIPFLKVDTLDKKSRIAANEYYPINIPVSDDSFITILEGDSLFPAYSDGTLLVVDPQLEPKNRDIVLVKFFEDPPVFRELLIDGHHYFFQTINKSIPSNDLGKKFTLLGIVVQAIFYPRKK